MADPVPASAELVERLSERIAAIQALLLNRPPYIKVEHLEDLKKKPLDEWEEAYTRGLHSTQVAQSNEEDDAGSGSARNAGGAGKEPQSEHKVQRAKKGNNVAEEEARLEAGEDAPL